MTKKIKKSKIVEKYLRGINLQVVSKDKCINGIKRENSAGNFYNNQTGHIPYIAGSKRERMSFSGMIKLEFLKVYRIKSIKSIIFFSFILEFLNKINKTKDTRH